MTAAQQDALLGITQDDAPASPDPPSKSVVLPAVGSADRGGSRRIEPIWLGPRPLALPRYPLAIRICLEQLPNSPSPRSARVSQSEWEEQRCAKVEQLEELSEAQARAGHLLASVELLEEAVLLRREILGHDHDEVAIAEER